MRLRPKADPFALTGEPKSYFLRPHLKGRWFEMDAMSQESGIKAEPLGLLAAPKKINYWLAVLAAGILILGLRAAYLQVFLGAHFYEVAEGNRLRLRDIKAARGIIYDRYRQPLVKNIPNFYLAVIPVDLPKIDDSAYPELIKELASIAAKTEEEITQFLSGQPAFSYQPAVVAENMSQEKAILTEILSGRFPGGILQIADSRYYLAPPAQTSFSHILGYEGKIEKNKLDDYLARGYSLDDQVGKAGVEFFYEKELKGINGREQVEVDATGKTKEVLASQKSAAGRNLVLTIDAGLQKQAEASLRRNLAGNGKKKGAVVALDPGSGEVLALVSLPAFDNNLFSFGISQADFSNLINDPAQPLFNRAISGEYPSGSTFKMIVGAAALQEGLINENTSFESIGGIQVDRWFFPDWKAGGHGWTSINKALAESINTFFYVIGGGLDDFTGLGVEKINEYAQRFGLNQTLGIDLPNEAAGFLPSKDWKEKTKKENWYIGDTYHFAIGQGDLLVTPLQVAGWTAVFANGGTLYRPHLVKEILDKDNNLVEEIIRRQILNRDFISQKNLKIINQGLRQAVVSGSAKGLGSLPIEVAAKTGTAQGQQSKEPPAWITAFAPYENPQLVITVLIEEGGEGSSVALPVARDLIGWWMANR